MRWPTRFTGALGLTALAPALAAVAVLAPTPTLALASAWQENPESRVRLVTPYRVATGEGELWLGLHFRLAPGWHVYWKNSGDAGFPPEIDLSAIPEVAAAELLWPAPARFELPGGLVAFGYEDEVVYPVRARIAAGGAAAVRLALALDYLVCEVDCVPYRYTLALDQPVGPEPVADPETAALLETWRNRLPRAAGELPGIETEARLEVSDPRRPVLEVTVEGAGPAPGERPELFLEVHDLFEPEAPELDESAAGLRFRVPLALKRTLAEPLAGSAFAWTVTGLARPDGGGDAFALEAQRHVAVSREAATAEALPAAGGWRRAIDGPGAPAVLTALALLLLLLALWLWGLLGARRTPPPGPPPPARGREALGFLAAAAVLGLLYLLSGRLASEDLAFIELSLLALGLAAWARARSARSVARGVWTLAMAAAAAAALWLAAVG